MRSRKSGCIGSTTIRRRSLAAESNEEPGGFGPGVGGVGFGGNKWLNRERIRDDSDIVLVGVNSGHRLLRGTKILEWHRKP
jgi:hypothetical protein